MPCRATVLMTISLAAPARSAELFRYQGDVMDGDGGTL